jgi:alkaline phosphatase
MAVVLNATPAVAAATPRARACSNNMEPTDKVPGFSGYQHVQLLLGFGLASMVQYRERCTVKVCSTGRA